MSVDEQRGRNSSVTKSLVLLVVGWAILLGVVALGFEYLVDRRENPNRMRVAGSGSAAPRLVLQQNFAGHYLVNGEINGRGVEFMLDTGATVVSVPETLAERLGLPRGPAIEVNTANGIARAWMTRIERLQFGPFEFRDVDASIAPGLDDERVLMGMNLLRQIELEQRGGELTLSAPST